MDDIAVFALLGGDGVGLNFMFYGEKIFFLFLFFFFNIYSGGS